MMAGNKKGRRKSLKDRCKKMKTNDSFNCAITRYFARVRWALNVYWKLYFEIASGMFGIFISTLIRSDESTRNENTG